MKRICFFIHNIFKTGGTERVTITLANELVERGYEVDIISSQSGKKVKFEINNKINIYNLKSEEHFNSIKRKMYVSNSINEIIKRNRVEILICVDVALYLYTLGRCKNTKIIAWEHFNYYYNLGSKSRTLSRKLAAKYADALVVLSKNDYQSYKKEIKNIKKITYIYNPVPFSIKDRKKGFNGRILSIGRYTTQKGFDLLLKAWKELDGKLDGWQLKIVGDGIERESLEKFIESNKLNNVELAYFTEDIVSEYSKADLFVLSSRFEGFGMVILEAQSTGIPVVSFDCPYGPSELIENGKTGVLVNNGDIKALEEKIIEMCNNKNLRKNISLNALKSAEKFDVKNIATQWEILFKEI